MSKKKNEVEVVIRNLNEVQEGVKHLAEVYKADFIAIAKTLNSIKSQFDAVGEIEKSIRDRYVLDDVKSRTFKATLTPAERNLLTDEMEQYHSQKVSIEVFQIEISKFENYISDKGIEDKVNSALLAPLLGVILV